MHTKTIRMFRIAACTAFAIGTVMGALAQDGARYLSPGEADQALANSLLATTAERNEIRAVLLQPTGWLANWERPGEKGQSAMVFEARGENVVVKIRNLNYQTTCEKDVVIAEGKVKFDGCYDTDITLRFEPGDKNFPFKGASSKGFGYMLQVNSGG